MATETLEFSGLVIDGICEDCFKVGKVGVIFAGKYQETLIFLCRECGQRRGVKPPPENKAEKR